MAEYLDYDEVIERFDHMLDWLAKTYVKALEHHSLHARQILSRAIDVRVA